MISRLGQFSGLLLLMTILHAAGCATNNATVASAFPAGASAAPWVLQDSVWSGSFAEAAPALGSDADDWRQFDPTRVWLAIYRHDSQPDRRLTVRAFAFESAPSARRAFEHFRPVGATEFRAGTDGCWTSIGVLFVWDRLVFDIFGSQAHWQSEVQSALLAGYIQSAMPDGLPGAPQ